MGTQEEIRSLASREKEKIWSLFLQIRNHLTPVKLSGIKKHEFNALLFLSVEEPVELCRLLNRSFRELENIINDPSYALFKIPKRRGGYREISAPEGALKMVQKRLNFFLQAYYLCTKPPQVTGFVINPCYLGKICNIAENARPHIGKRFVLNIDLEDFFPTIKANRILELFMSDLFGFNRQISTALALLTTYDGKLPVGAPTSPAISNFIAFHLDHGLINLCVSNDITYSRYADDMTFSSNQPFSKQILTGIESTIASHQFKLNQNKTRITNSNRRQTVTGLTVNQKVNVSRKFIKQTRAMLHDLSMNGLSAATCNHFRIDKCSPEQQKFFLNRLNGNKNFIKQIRRKMV